MLSHEPLQLPFKIQEFNEDMVVALDRNFAAIEQALSRIQVYHNMPEFHKILEGSESAKSYLHEYGDVKMFRQQTTPPLGSGSDEAAENDFWIYYENGNPVWKQVKQGNWEHVNLRPTQGDSVDMLAVVGIDAEIITAGYIRAGRIEAGSITGDKINAFTTIIAGEGNEIGALSGVGNYRIYAGHAQASAAPFSVYKDGAIYSSSGLIGGWSIDGEAGLKLGALGNTRGIATGDYTFYAGDASPEHAPFSVTKEGNLIASTGSLNALNLGEPGATAGLFISNTNLGYFDGGTWKTYMDNTGSFYLGGANGSLTWDGSSLTIDGSGKFTGELVANSGFIGGTNGWIIESGRIYSQDIELKTGVGTNGYIRNNNNRWIFYNDGSGQLASGTLSWTAAGVLTLTGGFLGGDNRVQIDASGLDVGSLGSIRGGATGVATGNGFWMGYAGGAYQFRIGTASGANSIRWDGSILSIRGALNADDIVAGTIVADSVDSGWVYTNSIHADQITAGTIVADSVDSNWVYTNSIHADQITAGYIHANRIEAGSIEAGKLNVFDLSAITADFSALYAGSSTNYSYLSSGGYEGVVSNTTRMKLERSVLSIYDSNGSQVGRINASGLSQFACGAVGSGRSATFDSNLGYMQLKQNGGIDFYTSGNDYVFSNRTVYCQSGLEVNGTKNFRIPHPLYYDTKDLFHSSIESPRYDLLYRGTGKLKKGKLVVNIDEASNMSDGTFESLTQYPEVIGLRNKTSFYRLKATEVENGEFTIFCEEPTDDEVSWVVMAERADDSIKKYSRNSDSEGRLIPELELPPGFRADEIHRDALAENYIYNKNQESKELERRPKEVGKVKPE